MSDSDDTSPLYDADVRCERDELRALIRAAEWNGSGGRCPWCEEWPAVPAKNFPGGHAEDCPARKYFGVPAPLLTRTP